MKRTLATIVLLLQVVSIAFAGVASTVVLKRAETYLPVLSLKLKTYWPSYTMPQIPAGQVEQESSWNPRATLKTDREIGRGLTQMTITKNFNIYKTAVQMKPLKGWDWEKDPYNPSNQLTFLVLQDKDNFTQVKKLGFINDTECSAAMLVSYNAGLGTVLNRRAVAKKAGRWNGKWFEGLDGIRTPAEKTTRLYGENLGDVRNEYPVVIFKRAEKYKGKL